MNLRALPYMIALVASVVVIGCALQPVNAQSSSDDKNSANACPIQESRNWHAWIDRVSGASQSSRLNISGQIDLPNPGYTVSWKSGPLDRRNPPSLRLFIETQAPEGVVAQVIDPRDVRYELETKVLHYRSILILCGDRKLGEIPDVTPTE